jgi:sensor histidine kinase YesM
MSTFIPGYALSEPRNFYDSYFEEISGMKNKWWFHVAFSSVVIASLLLGMYLLYLAGFRFHELPSAFTDCFFFLLCIYVGRWLGNQYLKSKLAVFISYLLTVITMLAVFKWLLVKYVFNHSYAGFFEVVRNTMPFFLVGLVAGILVKLIRSSIQKELNDSHLQGQQKTTEFDLLQSQLSPHFLFNTLNNLYGISIEQHERIPPLLLKLSHLLRYSVYGGKKQMVTLTEELDYIKTYIEFEQIRISDRLILKTNIAQVTDSTIKIAPMVLIVFIENAFKHAKNTIAQKIYIAVDLQVADGFINFSVVNSYNEEVNQAQTKDEHSGIGLTNTIKRLNLLYGNSYELQQHSGNDVYQVQIKLKINR